MTILLDDPCDSLAAYTSIFGDVTVSATQPKTGANSLKCDTTVGAAQACAEVAGVCADAGRRINWWAYFPSADFGGGASYTEIMQIRHSSNGINIGLEVNPAGQLRLNTGTVTATGSTLANATYHRLTFSYVITNATTYTVKLFVNGALDITLTDNGSVGTGGADMRVGYSQSRLGDFGASHLMYIDEVYVDDAATLDDPFASAPPSAGAGIGLFSPRGTTQPVASGWA